VFLLRMNDGVLPSLKQSSSLFRGAVSENQEDSTSNQTRIDEERRCAYVAITRTRKRLVLSYASFDDEKGVAMAPSTFLFELGLLGPQKANILDVKTTEEDVV
jgi:superfamily I DNA/RNA helicase